MNLWTITDIGAVRQQNQDFCRAEVLPDGRMLLIACDGMGGARAGNVASELTALTFGDSVLEGLSDPERAGNIEELLQESVAIANHAVWHRSGTDPDCLGMGTTLVAAYISEGICRIVNVGDSRAYIVTEEGIRRVTRDHSLVEDLVQSGEITPEQARTHPQKNLITRAMGAAPDTKADLFEEPCVEGGYLLLCTDGLSNLVTDQEILYEVIHGGPQEDCCKRLLDTALQRGAPDNVTVILLQM